MRRRHADTIALQVTKWVGVAGAVLIALNIGAVAVGFALLLISWLLWSAVGWIHRELSLVVLQGAFTVISVLGIFRWATF